jgi:hypothetical protein
MSRHRRTPSQAIPSEIFAADIFNKPFDLTPPNTTNLEAQSSTNGATRSTIAQHNTNQEIKAEFAAPPAVTTAPVKPKAPPVNKSA